jgi:transcriptional regulator with XRE-family HTH domain
MVNSSAGEATRAIQAAGELIRELRRANGMSINTLAESADLSPGLLSQIERGIGNPSLTTIVKLAQSLGVPTSRFFEGQEDAGAVVRADSRPRLQVSEDHLVYELLTPNMQGAIGVIRTEIVPGWTNRAAPFRHVGEECSVVIEGNIFISVGGQGYELSTGDSITYNSNLEHWYRNDTHSTAILISSMTPPSF